LNRRSKQSKYKIPDAFFIPAALAWMVVCAVIPYLVFALPNRFFASDRRAGIQPPIQ
jgi:hypothetical protein